MNSKILVVDDEESLAEFVCRALRQNGYGTLCAFDGDEALRLIEEELPDLVILDLMLPMMDGWEVCRRAKANSATKDIPIMMLTARSSPVDAVQGLDLGADDYLRKPFPLDELLARVRVLLRRKRHETKYDVIEEGSLRLDLSDKEAWLREAPLDLSPTEFEILAMLVERVGHAVSRDAILRRIWGLSGDTRTVDVHVSRLRKKLDDGVLPLPVIRSSRGRGYKLVWEEEGQRCSTE